MRASFRRSLIAILAGNAIYFSVQRWLPPKAQHHPFAIDWGLAVDFWLCLFCWGLLGFLRTNR